jgi:hypothetical protein
MVLQTDRVFVSSSFTHKNSHRFLENYYHIMSPPVSNIMVPTQQVALSKPCCEELTECCAKRNVLSTFMKTFSRKRPLNMSRSESFNSQKTSATDSTDTTVQSEQSVISIVERSVHFEVTKPDTLHFILSRHDYTAEEKQAAWFQEKEYAMITRECCRQVRKMENGESLKDKKYCSRGLESHTRIAAISKSQNRKLAVNAVLDEQDEQELDTPDEESISHAYCQVTSSCQFWASTIGLRDQRSAEECMD